MKRKILLFFSLVFVLVCIFALTVSAKDRETVEFTDADGVTHQVPIVRFENANMDDHKAAMQDIVHLNTLEYFTKDESAYTVLKATDGTLTAYPTWYLVVPSGSATNYIAISEIRYQYINQLQTEKTYKDGAVMYIEFPEGMTHARDNGVFGRGTHYETNVVEMVFPKSLYEIQPGAFKQNNSLKRVYIKDGSLINTIGDDAFNSCSSLEYFEFDKLTSLVSIDGFNWCTKLGGGVLDLTRSESLEKLGTNCFRAIEFTEVKLPNSVKILDSECLKECNLQRFTFPESLESIGTDAFVGNNNVVFNTGILPKNLKSVGSNFMYGCTKAPNLIVFPAGVTVIPDEGFANVRTANGGKLDIVFLGRMTKVIIDGSAHQDWASHVTIYFANNTISDFNGKVYSFTDPVAGTLGSATSQTGTLTYDISGKSVAGTSKVGDNFMEFIFCGSNGKVEQSYALANDGSSISADRGLYDFNGHICQIYYADYTDCTSDKVCFICDVNKASSEHNYAYNISYPNGFTVNGVKGQACTNPQCCVAQGGEVAEAIFVCLGVSVSEFGEEPSITQGFVINHTAYNEYVASGKSLSFGIIFAVQSIAGDAPMEIVSGKAQLKEGVQAIVVDEDKVSANSYLDVKVTGIPEKDFDTAIILSLYVCDGESIYYISKGTQSLTAGTVTYNNK